jgi:ribonuclease P protein component
MQHVGLIAGFLQSKEHRNEANLPTFRGAPQAYAWRPRAHADARRARGDPCASREGSRPAGHLTIGDPGAARSRLRRGQRLGAAAVSAVLKSGRLTRSSRLYLYRAPNAVGCSRLALVVPKRFAPRAVLRNRIRRLAREAFRLCQADIGAQDCVVRLVKAPGDTPVSRAELEALFRRSVND